MDAPAGACTFCGQPAVDRHHVTGRGPTGEYLHPDLVADVCHRHHELAHTDLRALRLDTIDGDSTRLGLVEHALRRIASFLGRYSMYADNPLWDWVARTLVDLADDLNRISGAAGAPA